MNFTKPDTPPVINPEKPSASPATRAETARINGAKSNGPATPDGRAISSRNSLRHGLTAKAVVLETESQDEFAALLDSFLDRFHPADPVEQELVETMAAARWRLRRLYTIESRILEIELVRRADSLDQEFNGIDDPDRLAHAFQHLADNSRSLSLLVRYEASLNRTFDRALKQLILLQSARPSTPTLGSFRNPAQSPEKGDGLLCPQPIFPDPTCQPVSGQSGPSPFSSPAAAESQPVAAEPHPAAETQPVTETPKPAATPLPILRQPARNE